MDRRLIFEVVAEWKFIYVIEAFIVVEDNLRTGRSIKIGCITMIEIHGMMVGRGSARYWRQHTML